MPNAIPKAESVAGKAIHRSRTSADGGLAGGAIRLGRRR